MLVFLLFKKESESDYMLTIETKELKISEKLKIVIMNISLLKNLKN